MTKTPRDLDLKGSSNDLDSRETSLRKRLGHFFRTRRLENRLSESYIADALALSSPETVSGYETGKIPVPLEDVYVLTNVLNLAPEAVMDLIQGLYAVGTD